MNTSEFSQKRHRDASLPLLLLPTGLHSGLKWAFLTSVACYTYAKHKLQQPMDQFAMHSCQITLTFGASLINVYNLLPFDHPEPESGADNQ